MNNISYNYQIISVDAAARCMVIMYSSEGRETLQISARLPFEGEQLLDVIQMYAPIPYWREKELAVVVPEVGLAGSVVLAPTPAKQQAADVPVDGAVTL